MESYDIWPTKERDYDAREILLSCVEVWVLTNLKLCNKLLAVLNKFLLISVSDDNKGGKNHENLFPLVPAK